MFISAANLDLVKYLGFLQKTWSFLGENVFVAGDEVATDGVADTVTGLAAGTASAIAVGRIADILASVAPEICLPSGNEQFYIHKF